MGILCVSTRLNLIYPLWQQHLCVVYHSASDRIVHTVNGWQPHQLRHHYRRRRRRRRHPRYYQSRYHRYHSHSHYQHHYRAVAPQYYQYYYYYYRRRRHYHRPQLLRPRALVGDIIDPYSLLDVLLLTADFVVLVTVCFACRFLISRLLLLLILLFSTSWIQYN